MIVSRIRRQFQFSNALLRSIWLCVQTAGNALLCGWAWRVSSRNGWLQNRNNWQDYLTCSVNMATETNTKLIGVDLGAQNTIVVEEDGEIIRTSTGKSRI